MIKYDDYKQDLMERLKDPKRCVGYLKEAKKDEDPRVFLLALKDVIEAQGGMTKASRKANLSRTSMYRALSGERYPNILTLNKMLNSVGIDFEPVLMSNK